LCIATILAQLYHNADAALTLTVWFVSQVVIVQLFFQASFVDLSGHRSLLL